MQDTVSKVDGFASLPPNLSSVPFTGRLEPGCGHTKTCQIITLGIYLLMNRIYGSLY